MTSDSPGGFPGNERFEIEERLGAGAFGVVYKAFDRTRGERVALKRLHHAGPRALYRFKREFRALSGTRHPNLARLYELFADGDDWFLTMELVDGIDLLSYLATHDPAEPERRWGRLRTSFSQLARGVAALHEAGKLHRDLKPPNVLVGPSGRVVVLDFGLIADLGGQSVAQTMDLLGSPAYMSPEQVAGEGATRASDWYSVGVMLFESLTGRLPFSGKAMQIMRAKLDRAPALPEDLDPEVPDDLAALCLALLRRNPRERPPSAEVLEVLSAQAPPRSGAPAASVGTGLVGRDTELARLLAAWKVAQTGRAVVVRVTGSSGLGKTALIETFLSRLEAERQPPQVFRGRCYQQESVPYKALDSVVDSLVRRLRGLDAAELERLLPGEMGALQRIFPVLREVGVSAGAAAATDAQELRRRGAVGLRELLNRLAARGPLVICIDDLQWGDTDSVGILREVLRPPHPPAILFVVAFRSEERAKAHLEAANRVLDLVGEVEELSLEPIRAEDAMRFAQHHLGDTPAARHLAVRLASESRGVPVVLSALVDFVRLAPTEGDDPPTTIEEVVGRRTSELSAGARQMLEAIALADGPMATEAALGLDGIDAPSSALHELVSHRLVRSSEHDAAAPEMLDLLHDRVREVIAGGIPRERTRELHLRIAAALQGWPKADPETIARHLLEAGEASRAAGFVAEAAGKAASALAFDRAARLYENALRLAEPAERNRLRRLTAEALDNAGRGPEAARAFEEIAQHLQGDEALEMRRRAAELLLQSGHFVEGLAKLQELLRALGLKRPPSRNNALVRMVARRTVRRFKGVRPRQRRAADVDRRDLLRIDLCWSVVLGLAAVDVIESEYFQARHLDLALSAGEPLRVARALVAEASLAPVTERYGGRSLEAAEALALQSDDPVAQGRIHFARGLRHYHDGRWLQSLELFEKAERDLRSSTMATFKELQLARLYGVAALCMIGDLKTLDARATEFLREAEDRGDRFSATNLQAGLASVRWLAADRPHDASEEADSALRAWSFPRKTLQHFFHLRTRIQVDLYLGNSAQAHADLHQGWPDLKESFLLQIAWVRVWAWYDRAMTSLAEAACGRERAERWADAAEAAERLRKEGRPWTLALASVVDGVLAAQRGNHERAVAALEIACDGFRRTDMALHLAATRRLLGSLQPAAEAAAESDAWMAAQGVVQPERLVRAVVPWVSASAK